MVKEWKSKMNYHSYGGRAELKKKATQRLERCDLNMGGGRERHALARECREWRKIVLEVMFDNGL
jgi:hypothetical protein